MFPSGWKRDPGYLDGFLPNGQCFIYGQCFIAEDDGDAALKDFADDCAENPRRLRNSDGSTR